MNKHDALYEKLAIQGRTLGEKIWRQLSACKNICLTSPTIVDECAMYLTGMFQGVFVNGATPTMDYDPYHPLRINHPDTVDGIIVCSLELYGGEYCFSLRPTPDDWLTTMGLINRKAKIVVVHLHACAESNDAITLYNAAWTQFSDHSVLTKLRTEGVHIGYTAESSLDLSIPL